MIDTVWQPAQTLRCLSLVICWCTALIIVNGRTTVKSWNPFALSASLLLSHSNAFSPVCCVPCESLQSKWRLFLGVIRMAFLKFGLISFPLVTKVPSLLLQLCVLVLRLRMCSPPLLYTPLEDDNLKHHCSWHFINGLPQHISRGCLSSWWCWQAWQGTTQKPKRAGCSSLGRGHSSCRIKWCDWAAQPWQYLEEKCRTLWSWGVHSSPAVELEAKASSCLVQPPHWGGFA